jgi:phage terminase Nu1 subunit (DNA packaging protein)
LANYSSYFLQNNGNLDKTRQITASVTMARKAARQIKNKSFPLTQIEAAIIANVEPTTIARWGGEENPPPRDPDGSYPARDFGMWMMKYQTRKRGPGSVDNFPFAPDPVKKLRMPTLDDLKAIPLPGQETKEEAERRRTSAQADKFEMENAVNAGKLIPVETIETALANMVSIVRNRLLKLPVALAPLVSGDDDLYSVQQKLMDGVRDALAEVSVDWKSGVQDDVAEAD